MPNAKRIRQDQEAAQKRYLNYAAQIADYNAGVNRVNAANQSASDLYNQQAAAYNAFVEKVQSGQAEGLAEFRPGEWAQSSGGKILYLDKNGNPSGNAPLVNNVNELIQSGASAAWVRYGDEGKATYVKRDQAGAFDPAKAIAIDKKWAEIQANPTAYQVPANTSTGYRMNDEALAVMMQAGGNLGVMKFDKAAPVAQEVGPTPEEPKGWNPSRRELAELQAPTVDAAGSQMATARGEGAKTGLVNEAAGRDSAFADPEDPTNLADKGILARVLGGQL